MGNVKSIPVIGETVTVVESGVKIVAAGVIAPFDKEEASKLADGAGQAWVEYSEKNLIAGPINAVIRSAKGDEEGAERVLKSTGKAFESVVDSAPVIGHVKGIVHHIAGDHEHGNQCLTQSSRGVIVLGAGLATGGLGAGVVAGGLAGIGGGIAYDGIHSAIDSEVQGERRTHGLWNIDRDLKAVKDSNDVANVELSVAMSLVGDFMAGSSGAEVGKAVRKAYKIKVKQNNLETAVKKNLPDVDPQIARKDMVEAARNLDDLRQDGTVKGDGHVSTRVRNMETGDVHQGYSSRARTNINVKNFETNGEASGFPSKSQARKPAKTSALMEQNPEIEPALSRTPATCAEHQAYDAYYRNADAGSAPRVTQLVSVAMKNGVYETVVRCENCLKYATAMGEAITDAISGMVVPVERITPIITQACQCGALALGIEIVCRPRSEKKKC